MVDTIPVYAQTRKICQLLDIDPLGLIGSGSLLICCRKAASRDLIKAINKAGIDVTCIGEVLQPGQGIIAGRDNQPLSWPQFETDELYVSSVGGSAVKSFFVLILLKLPSFFKSLLVPDT